MKTRTIFSGTILILLLCAIVIPAQAQTASPQETLDQYVADLQKSPDDTALREKIIKLVLEMSPAPETPAEAKRHMSRGVAAVEDAKTPDDFKDACNEFRQATTLAPWLADAYRNLAIAQDKAGMYDEALASLRLYLLTKPSSSDADWAEDLKSKVEYRKEKAAKEAEAKAKESSPEAIAAKKQNEFDEWLKKLDGRRYTYTPPNPGAATSVIDIRGGLLTWGTIFPPGYAGGEGYRPDYYANHIRIRSREITVPVPEVAERARRSGLEVWTLSLAFIISEDGDSVIFHGLLSDGSTGNDTTYFWQR
ncbi:MAG: tetratricopeptide repeat protein [Terriglobia bacterium]|jgi:tetratricopeptide (TPR) repeat protein